MFSKELRGPYFGDPCEGEMISLEFYAMIALIIVVHGFTKAYPKTNRVHWPHVTAKFGVQKINLLVVGQSFMSPIILIVEFKL